MFDRRGLTLLSITILVSCGGSSLDAVTSGGDSGADSSGGTADASDAGAGSGGAGSGGATGTGGAAVVDAGADVGSDGAIAGSGGAGGSGGSADAGTYKEPTPAPPSGNSLTGTLGTLGPAKPIVAGFVVHTGIQGRAYLSSAPLTCAQMMTAGWLSSAVAGSQVTEVVVWRWEGAVVSEIGIAGTGVPPAGVGEVNYAVGGKSSADAVKAKSGRILNEGLGDGGMHGDLDATFADGSQLAGIFHVHFCPGGQLW